jgi:hypothetical protein
MARVEIDESELARLKRVSEIATLIGKDPKARRMLKDAAAIARRVAESDNGKD